MTPQNKLGLICVALLSINTCQIREVSGAQLNFSNSALRQSVANELRIKSLSKRKRAEAWARTHGAEIEFQIKGVHYKLMAVRDGRPMYYRTLTENAAISTGVNHVRNQVPYNLNGEGLTIGLWDATRPLRSHQEFQNLSDRIIVFDPATAKLEAHATPMASIIGASGVDPRATGMAPSVSIHSYDWDSDVSEMAERGASYPNEPGTLCLSNHSYGVVLGWMQVDENAWAWLPLFEEGEPMIETGFGQYNSDSVEYDRVAYMAPYFLSFVAAGNDRDDNPQPGDDIYFTTGQNRYYLQPDPYDGYPAGDGVDNGGYYTLNGLAVAKNVVTVGAVTDAVIDGIRQISDVNATDFSNWGPTDDGRIKPDLVANGEQLYTAGGRCNTCYEDDMSGTSLACANASGSAILLVQHYGRLYPGHAMQSSTLKGLVLHCADDLGNPGPDYAYGWGLMNIESALRLLDDHANGDTGTRLSEGLFSGSLRAATYRIHQEDGSPLRVTLCWTDPQGTERGGHNDRNPCLVHDLDLRIIGPHGTETFLPYVLDWEIPSAPAQSGDNQRDNVEQVVISNPASGVYEVRVTYKGTLQKEKQRYSLISSHPLAPSEESRPGNSTWTRQFGSPSRDTGTSIAVDDHGDVYVAGNTHGSAYGDSKGNQEVFLTKHTNEGYFLWALQFGTPLNDSVNGIAVDTSGHITVGGHRGVHNYYQELHRQFDIFIRKYTTQGDLIWKRDLTSPHENNDKLWDLTVDLSGNILLTGSTDGSFETDDSFQGTKEVLLAKYDSEGTLQWVRQYRTQSERDAEGMGITTDSTGNVFITGKSEGGLLGPKLGGDDAFVMKYDTDGELLWTKVLGAGGRDTGTDIITDSQGNVYVTGFSSAAFDSPKAGNIDLFISKLDTTGAILWTQRMDNTSDNVSNGIALDPRGDLYITGWVNGALDTSAHGSNDIFVGKYDSDGTLLNIYQTGCKTVDEGLGIATDHLGNVFSVGHTFGSFGRVSLGENDIVLIKVPPSLNQ
jgi:hypothetical protein